MDKNVERAKSVLLSHWRDELQSGRAVMHANNAVAALVSNGLLVTDLHVRALVACEEMSGEWRPKSASEDARAIGRESLAAKKPKARWAVRDCGDAKSNYGWTLYDERRNIVMCSGFDEVQARAVAAALNESEASR